MVSPAQEAFAGSENYDQLRSFHFRKFEKKIQLQQKIMEMTRTNYYLILLGLTMVSISNVDSIFLTHNVPEVYNRAIKENQVTFYLQHNIQ